MPRYKLKIEYLGTNFSGWQKQKNSYSVQEAIEKAAYTLLQQKINLVVAGRTDAGVHAEGQVAHFDIENEFCSRKIQLGINFHLMNQRFGKDISVKKAIKVSNNFNARFSAKKKLYQYLIFNSVYRSPILYEKSWWVRKRLDHEKMLKASQNLIGSHDFSSFRAKGCQASSPFRTIEKIKISKEKNIIKLNFLAKSFLYNQVRIMTGTLRDVGIGLLSSEDVIKILNRKNRKCAGITAPSKGLTLKRVSY
tara:strand:- start:500 stop:1249 length:750 start_codon:yes stop_codon:yes gene_type:complete